MTKRTSQMVINGMGTLQLLEVIQEFYEMGGKIEKCSLREYSILDAYWYKFIKYNQ